MPNTELNGELNIEHALDGTTGENERALGRIPSIDFRDRKFLMQLPPPEKPIDRLSRHWITVKPLDQGEKPHCVAFCGHQYLLSAPVKNLPFSTTTELYNECQRLDEWLGEDYDGTSVRALFKSLKAHGLVSEYRWAFDIERVIYHLMMKSPVVFGTNWYQGMFDPDQLGFIRATGQVAGGHAYMVKGANLEKECPDGSVGALRIINSWGASWGQGGKAWISIRDASRLISEFGEAACADEIKFRAVGE